MSSRAIATNGAGTGWTGERGEGRRIGMESSGPAYRAEARFRQNTKHGTGVRAKAPTPVDHEAWGGSVSAEAVTPTDREAWGGSKC
ncbi:hypothetical protein BO443_110122 [Burkholderia orbicola]